MELWITINKCTKQLTNICRYQCFYFQYGIQYKFPYLVSNRQLERIIFQLHLQRVNQWFHMIKIDSQCRVYYTALESV